MPAPSDAMPTYDRMMWPALQALKKAGGSATNQEHLEEVAKLMGLTEEVLVVLHKEGPATEVGYRLSWARTYLKKAGALESSARAVWTITPVGLALSESDVAAIPGKVRRGEYGGGPDPEPDKELEAAAAWKDQLLKVLKAMRPDRFERLAQRILRESGFVRVEVTGRTGDGGIDGVGVLRLTLISFQVFFQCKKYDGIVGASVIRDFRGAMVGRTDKGLVITTGRFSRDAKNEAGRDGAPPVELIDGEQLCDLLKQLKMGVRTELVEHVTVVPDYFGDI